VADEENMPRSLNALAREECGGIDPYECEEAIQRLNDYLDHQLSEMERVVVLKHLEICRPCLRKFTFEQTLIVSLRRKIHSVCAPEPLREKLHALLRQEH
jgi:anti-sigma factor (TIGR02949 family)